MREDRHAKIRGEEAADGEGRRAKQEEEWNSWRDLKSGFGRKIFPTRLHVRSGRLARLHSLFLPVRLFLTKRLTLFPFREDNAEYSEKENFDIGIRVRNQTLDLWA